MTTKPKIDVVLTPDARVILKDESLIIYIKDGSHFNCESVEQNGSFLDMKLKLPKTIQTDKRVKDFVTDFVIDLSIPVQFVLYMISEEAHKSLGFDSEQ